MATQNERIVALELEVACLKSALSALEARLGNNGLARRAQSDAPGVLGLSNAAKRSIVLDNLSKSYNRGLADAHDQG